MKKKCFNFFYCCNRIILALVLQLICETVFFSYLYYPLALLVADLALFERIIASGEGWQSGSEFPHMCYGFPCVGHSKVLCQCCLWTSGTYWWWYSLLHWTFMQSGSVSQLSVVDLSCTSNKKSSPLCRFQILTIVKTIITASTSDPRIIVSVAAFNQYLNDFIKVAHS